jgi:hypothetical protein
MEVCGVVAGRFVDGDQVPPGTNARCRFLHEGEAEPFNFYEISSPFVGNRRKPVA